MRIGRLALLALASAGTLRGQAPGPDSLDVVRLAEAFRLARAVQSMWPRWEATAFPVLLVGPEHEFLMGHANPPPGFDYIGQSAMLETRVWSRPRHFRPDLLATFPAFGPPAVIVVGRAEATRKTSTAWTITVLHEHFHQYQSGSPDYYAAVEQLGLSDGDQTGMWMLNYPFPYTAPDVAAGFDSLSRQLARVAEQPSANGRRGFWHAYRTFLARLKESDRRYLGFQLWQEGVARYVELRVAEAASRGYEPSQAFPQLWDFESYAAVSARIRRDLFSELSASDLAARGRESFYAFGAGLALLLDQDAPGWKSRYLTDRFALERFAP